MRQKQLKRRTHALNYTNSGYVDFGNVHTLAFPFTIQVEFARNTISGVTETLFSKGNSALFKNTNYVAKLANNNTLQVGGGDGTNFFRSTWDNTDFQFSSGIPYDLVLVFNDYNDIELHVNGQRIGGEALDGTAVTVAANSGNMFLGSSTTTSEEVNAKIQMFRIWDDAVTTDEIKNMHFNDIVPTGNLVGGYFNSIEVDGAGTVLTDSVGSNDGTISDAGMWKPLV